MRQKLKETSINCLGWKRPEESVGGEASFVQKGGFGGFLSKSVLKNAISDRASKADGWAIR